MKLTTAGRRMACSAAALTCGALLAFAGPASADTYNVSDTAEFEAAILAANASIGEPDTIQLAPSGTFTPNQTVNVLDDLTIRGTPQLQQPAQGATILQGSAIPPANPMVRVNEGVTLTVLALQMQTGGDIEAPGIEVFGSYVMENSTLSGMNGHAIATSPEALGTPSVTIVNSTLQGNNRTGVVIRSTSTLSMNYTTVTSNAGGGLTLEGESDIRNSIIALNSVGQCIGGTPGDPRYNVNYIVDTDVEQINTPGVGDCRAYDPDGGEGNITTGNSAGAVGVAAIFGANGGPTRTRALTASSVARDSSDGTGCRTVDQRYFVRSDATCDRGAFEFGAVRDTIPPSCGVTAVRRDPPPQQQDVTVLDSGSGLELIDEIEITNGTVAEPIFELGERDGVVVTATKTNQAEKTRWSFRARDVAGNVTDCR
jgi:hypothetical protein